MIKYNEYLKSKGKKNFPLPLFTLIMEPTSSLSLRSRSRDRYRAQQERDNYLFHTVGLLLFVCSTSSFIFHAFFSPYSIE